MLDSDTVIRSPHDATVTRVGGKKRVKVHDPRTSVTIKTLGAELVVFFDDSGRQGPVRELRLLADTEAIEPSVLRQIAQRWPMYVKYARSAMTSADDDWRASLEALRELGNTRRGLSDEFYRRVGFKYGALIAEGERHPVKAMKEEAQVEMSTASRWITEARRRGYIDEQA